MSAPRTNLEKQKKRHLGPLLGMGAAVTLVLIGFVWWLGYELDEAAPADGSETETAPLSEIPPQTETLPTPPTTTP